MLNNLQSQLKAHTIAAAIYAITGTQPDVIVYKNQNPLVTFSPENAKKVQTFIEKQMQKKADVDINFFPAIAPIVFKKVFPFAAAGIAACFLFGYFIGKR